MGVTRLDRRGFLKTAARGGLAAASLLRSPAVLLTPAPTLLGSARAGTVGREPLVQPPQIRSKDGVLKTTITAAPGQVQLGEYSFPGYFYDGAYMPPVLRPRLGDVMRIAFKNDIPDQPSNLHFHGMSVSPQGNSDNVFIHVHPGQQFDYEVRIPANDRQRPGLFWYHPHAHGEVAKQMLGGLSGGLIVDGSDQVYPILRGLPEQLLLIKHAEVADDHEIISINGQVNPLVQIRPGEMQFWRIANIGATLFIKFQIETMPLYVIATDGHFLKQPRKMTEFFISPGQRIDAIAIGPPAGEYAMRTISFQNETWRKPEPVLPMATIVSTGSQPSSANAERDVLAARSDEPRWIDEVRSAPIVKRRTLVYSKTPDRRVFMINGRVMEENRIDETVKLGDTEEWTIINIDEQYHSFHIHQTPFLVTEVNGARPPDDDSLHDTYPLPPMQNDQPGKLKVVIPFTDPVIVGRFVYHCHAVDHEDKGMMGVIEVVA
jgi:suppressor of ftsI